LPELSDGFDSVDLLSDVELPEDDFASDDGAADSPPLPDLLPASDVDFFA
jgi:hypothetical protein